MAGPSLSLDDIGVSPTPASPDGKLSLSDLGVSPNMPNPSMQPNIDLESGDSNVRFPQRVAGGTFFPTDSRQNEIYLQGQGLETMRGPGGELLARETPDQPFRPVQQGLSSHPLSELGTRLASGGGELVKMIAMGIGGAGGASLGTAAGGPLGAMGAGALGAGSGYAVGGEMMSEMGERVLGVPGNEQFGEEDTDMATDMLVGAGGQLAGPYVQKLASGAGAAGQQIRNFLMGKLDKVQAFEKLNSIFKINPKMLGEGVIEAAEAGGKPAQQAALGLETHISEVYEHMIPTFKKAVARADAEAAVTGKPANELFALGKVLGEEATRAGEVVGATIDDLSALPQGQTISLSRIRDVGKKAIEAIKLRDGHVGSDNLPIGSKGEMIDSIIGGELDKFVQDRVTKATGELEGVRAQLKILGAKAGQPGVAEQLQKLQVQELQLKAQAADPTGTVKDIWNFKRQLWDNAKAALDGRNLSAKNVSSEYAEVAKATANELEAIAMTVDPKLGARYANEAYTFSVVSDAQKLAAPAIGEAITQATPITGDGALQGGRVLKNSASGLSRIIRERVIGGTKRALFQPYTPPPPTSGQEFRRAVSILPSNPAAEMQSAYNASRYREMAQKAAQQPLVRQITGTAVSSRSMDFIAPQDANADPNIGPLKDGIMLSTLVDNGLAPPEARETGFDINQLPPQIAQQVGMSVQAALQPLQDALKFGSEDEIGAAYSQVMKQFPELFPPPVTGIKGEVVDSQGRIRLYDPADRARYASQIQVDSGMDWGEKAKVVSELNSTFTVLNPKKPK
jgi:hypothetical protein